jgi:hypothetical protein
MTYTFEDFLTKTNSEDTVTLELKKNNKKTGQSLEVSGVEAKSVSNSRIKWQVSRAAIAEKYKDEKDQSILLTEKKQEDEVINIDFAMVLVKEWSFGELDKKMLFQLLEENDGLAWAIIAIAYGHEAKHKKK